MIRSIPAPKFRPAFTSARRTAATQAGSPFEGRQDRSKGPARRRVEQGLHPLSERDDLADAFDGVVAERDVKRLGLSSVRPDERPEPRGAGIAFAAAPDRVQVGGDCHQLGQVVVQVAVVVRGIEQALSFGPAVWIVQNGVRRTNSTSVSTSAASRRTARRSSARPGSTSVRSARREHRLKPCPGSRTGAAAPRPSRLPPCSQSTTCCPRNPRSPRFDRRRSAWWAG